MENKSIERKSADARVVQAVRRLKSTRQKDNLMEVRKNQEDIKRPTMIKNNPIYINNNNQDKTKQNSSTILQTINKNLTSNNNDININNINNNNISTIMKNQRKANQCNTLVPKSSINKKDMSKNNSKIKISIDGSLQKPQTSSTNKTSNKTFDYETLKKYKKRKISDYQKNLLSQKSLEKYKEECVNLINKDFELKTLFEKVGITKSDDYLLYISNHFFNKPHFLFTLEILILEAVEEANTLKVFRTNKNVLPLKVVKENYYKDEIIKNLKIRIYEEEYNNKLKNFMKSLDTFMNDLKIKEL
jgi:hypothetical protein